MKKLLALIAVVALTLTVTACQFLTKTTTGATTKENATTTAQPAETETAVGGYAIYFADQGGYGIEINLYEDGTFYYSQYTSKLTWGKYTCDAATGTDEQGRTKMFKISFTENDVFGEGEHYIVKDAEGAVILTNIYESMSLQTRELAKQDALIDEVVQTVATYWSNDYENDSVMATFYSDNTYALDGINGAGEAGSMGTYALADGVYTLTEEDTNKTYTLTVAEAITLTVGEKSWTMTDMDPETVLLCTFTGTQAWGAVVTINVYENSVAVVNITLGENTFEDQRGSASYQSDYNLYYFVFNGEASMATYSEETGAYSFTYAIANENFASANTAEVSYKKVVAADEITWTIDYSLVAESLAGNTATLTCKSTADAETFVFEGSLWNGYVPVKVYLNAEGVAKAVYVWEGTEIEDAIGTWALEGNVFTITFGATAITSTIAE